MPPSESQNRFVENLFRSSEADLRNYVSARLGRRDDSDIEDIVQESFLRISSLPNHEPIRNPRGFLFRTARNLIIDLARKRTVRTASAGALHKSAVDKERERAEWLSPERQVSGQQELKVIMAAIDDLPDACRRVFLLQRQNDFSYAEVASRLNISESMVQKHMSKALCQLYKALP